ncbi:hypothetical protein CR513_54961, partial [Mucuna pruriens]
MDQVFELHELSCSITSDKDPIFLNMIWSELARAQKLIFNIFVWTTSLLYNINFIPLYKLLFMRWSMGKHHAFTFYFTT